MIIHLPLFKKPPKSMLIIPLGREDLYDGIEAAGIDFGITKPIIRSVIYNTVIESFKIEPPKLLASPKTQGEYHQIRQASNPAEFVFCSWCRHRSPLLL